jgi:hypothetical protein
MIEERDEEESIYDKETEKEESVEELAEDDEMDDIDEEIDDDYDETDLKLRLDKMEKRVMKVEEFMASIIEQNRVPEDDEEFDEED